MQYWLHCKVFLTIIRRPSARLTGEFAMTSIRSQRDVCAPCMMLCTNVRQHSALFPRCKLICIAKSRARGWFSGLHPLISDCSQLIQSVTPDRTLPIMSVPVVRICRNFVLSGAWLWNNVIKETLISLWYYSCQSDRCKCCCWRRGCRSDCRVIGPIVVCVVAISCMEIVIVVGVAISVVDLVVIVSPFLTVFSSSLMFDAFVRLYVVFMAFFVFEVVVIDTVVVLDVFVVFFLVFIAFWSVLGTTWSPL